MDLPTCPACGQSVLDDEAKDCPFCGASMSGKPQAKKPSAQAAAPKSAKPTATAKDESKPAKASSAPAAKKTDDDDPFAVDKAAKKGAVALRPEPSKGRAHEVVCPMCETPGFTSTKAGGRDVRCCNPECLVPIFTAPEVKKEKPPEEPTKTGPPKAAVYGGGALLVALVGVGVWFFVFRVTEVPTPEGALYVPGQSGSDDSATDDGDEPASDGSSSTATSSIEDPRTPQHIRAASLKAMEEACLRRENNRSKPYCRRLTATAFARTGNTEGALQQLDQMRALRPSIPYYRIDPLVELAWRGHQAGDAAAVKTRLDEAVAVAARLSTRGRSRLEYAVDLAAALIAADRLTDARKLIDAHEEMTPDGQFAGELSAMRAMKQFNADAYADEAPIYRWAAPQTVAVVIGLVAHGETEAAQKWATSQQNDEIRSEAILVWADESLRRALAAGNALDMSAIDAAAKGLPPSGRVRLYARLAGRYLRAEEKSEADALLVRAHAESKQPAPPGELLLPGMKDLMTLQLPAAAPLRMQALAAAELAVVESRAGHVEKSAAACDLAMQFLRGSTPSPMAIVQRLNEIKDLGSDAMKTKLKQALELKTDGEAFLAFNEYRRNCSKIADASANRFAVQEAILVAIVNAGLLDSVSGEIDGRSEQSDLNLREPWAVTRVPRLLIEQYTKNGNDDAAKPIVAMVNAAGNRGTIVEQLIAVAEKLIDDGKFKQAAQVFEGRGSGGMSDDQRESWRLRLAGRLIAEQKVDAAFEFVGGISDADESFRESALWFAAAQATQSGQARKVWEIGDKATWSATETVSIYGGLLESLDVPAPPKTASTGKTTGVPTSSR
ncbi:MAG: hypothetical protein HON53_04710 [Planctomycetaceae bacterium]|jgi:hypothetical protein|nr:hypothetical protein [Planctomycetaceae bacterium]MBT6154872.1 hypothetical protein [Planctomycetaceae bacterium]MBT6486739.1 hypothetical protein [Planctomycetaceae bacterium]MBT6496272.1 hypothetical protein [Planctomycetaceae bacterium]